MLKEIRPGVYVSDEDINLTLTDGRLTMLLAKGREVTEAEARRLGILKSDQAAEPTEFKAELGAETPSLVATSEDPGDQVLAIGSNATNPRARRRLSGS